MNGTSRGGDTEDVVIKYHDISKETECVKSEVGTSTSITATQSKSSESE